MFREDRPLLHLLHWGLHFGAVLRAKFATMLFFGRPGRQQGPKIGTFLDKIWTLGCARGDPWGLPGAPVVPVP